VAELRLLGPLEAVGDDGEPLVLGGQKQRAVLALLLLRANRVVSTDFLVDSLWGDNPPRTATTSLQNSISSLRKLLGPAALVTRSPGYMLVVPDEASDLARFEALVAEARTLQPDGRADKLREALALWRGPPLADLAYEPFAQGPIADLEEQRLAAVEQRIDADLAAGRHADLVGEVEALAKEHRLRERFQGQLMLCLYRSGRQAEALEVYRATREALVSELGIEPGRELRDLQQRILEQDPKLDAPAAAEPAATPASRQLVGRAAELAALVAGLDDSSRLWPTGSSSLRSAGSPTW
jgi:DNA-binding SARP family transcriptional activator